MYVKAFRFETNLDQNRLLKFKQENVITPRKKTHFSQSWNSQLLKAVRVLIVTTKTISLIVHEARNYLVIDKCDLFTFLDKISKKN